MVQSETRTITMQSRVDIPAGARPLYERLIDHTQHPGTIDTSAPDSANSRLPGNKIALRSNRLETKSGLLCSVECETANVDRTEG
jgi:hypothetical protein